MSEYNLKPVSMPVARDIMNNCWIRLFKKFTGITNASLNKEMHFTDEIWNEILGYRDADGNWVKGLADQIYDDYPFELTSNICLAFIKELEARDKGSYYDIYHNTGHFDKNSHILEKVRILKELENDEPRRNAKAEHSAGPEQSAKPTQDEESEGFV
jgi:hypothetical protein